jgi:flagellar motility protein MotE (MotC chaperone)
MKLPDLKQVRQVRLLPVVIFAGVALLLLKSAGIMTGGGYVLTGPIMVQAAGGGEAAAPAAEGGAAAMAMPEEPTMTDVSPTLDDGSPTLPLRGDAAAEGGHGEGGDAAAADAGHGAPTEGDAAAAPAEAGHGTDVAETAAAADAGHGADGAAGGEPSVAAAPCPPGESAALKPAAEGQGQAAGDNPEGFDFIKGPQDCAAGPDINQADALPLVKDGTGNLVPLETAAAGSEKQILERLSARRAELDQRESELDMRMALVEAAEKRIAERTATLEALEARINAMVDEKRTLEESQFVAVVSMYETMKPKDAAAIFDQLEMPVLLRVARAVNPRKMAPIMAKMDPLKAMELTAGLAVDQVEPTIEMAPANTVGELPQIVGQ